MSSVTACKSFFMVTPPFMLFFQALSRLRASGAGAGWLFSRLRNRRGVSGAIAQLYAGSALGRICRAFGLMKCRGIAARLSRAGKKIDARQHYAQYSERDDRTAFGDPMAVGIQIHLAVVSDNLLELAIELVLAAVCGSRMRYRYRRGSRFGLPVRFGWLEALEFLCGG